MFDFSKRMSGFAMTDPVVVCTTGKGEPIVAYVNEYQGREYAHIRTLYEGRNGEWCPGKQGISFPRDEMTDVLLKLAERFVGDTAPAPEKAQQPKLLDQAYAEAERQKMPKMSNGL